MERTEQDEQPLQRDSLQESLSQPEEMMLRYELDPNDQNNEISARWPMTERGWFARWLWRLLGLGDISHFIDQELTRMQRLLVLEYKLTNGMRRDHDRMIESFNMSQKVFGEEVIPQINRQTNAISSLLDRLQFYERNITLLGRSRKLYDKILAKKIAEREQEAEKKRIAEKAAAEGVTVGDDASDPAQLPLEGVGTVQGVETPTVLTLLDDAPVNSDEATDGDEPD